MTSFDKMVQDLYECVRRSQSQHEIYRRYRHDSSGAVTLEARKVWLLFTLDVNVALTRLERTAVRHDDMHLLELLQTLRQRIEAERMFFGDAWDVMNSSEDVKERARYAWNRADRKLTAALSDLAVYKEAQS